MEPASLKSVPLSMIDSESKSFVESDGRAAVKRRPQSNIGDPSIATMPDRRKHQSTTQSTMLVGRGDRHSSQLGVLIEDISRMVGLTESGSEDYKPDFMRMEKYQRCGKDGHKCKPLLLRFLPPSHNIRRHFVELPIHSCNGRHTLLPLPTHL